MQGKMKTSSPTLNSSITTATVTLSPSLKLNDVFHLDCMHDKSRQIISPGEDETDSLEIEQGIEMIGSIIRTAVRCDRKRCRAKRDAIQQNVATLDLNTLSLELQKLKEENESLRAINKQEQDKAAEMLRYKDVMLSHQYCEQYRREFVLQAEFEAELRRIRKAHARTATPAAFITSGPEATL
jgi:FtsZ-binding cell division protein ZapB